MLNEINEILNFEFREAVLPYSYYYLVVRFSPSLHMGNET